MKCLPAALNHDLSFRTLLPLEDVVRSTHLTSHPGPISGAASRHSRLVAWTPLLLVLVVVVTLDIAAGAPLVLLDAAAGGLFAAAFLVGVFLVGVFLLAGFFFGVLEVLALPAAAAASAFFFSRALRSLSRRLASRASRSSSDSPEGPLAVAAEVVLVAAVAVAASCC